MYHDICKVLVNNCNTVLEGVVALSHPGTPPLPLRGHTGYHYVVYYSDSSLWGMKIMHSLPMEDLHRTQYAIN